MRRRTLPVAVALMAAVSNAVASSAAETEKIIREPDKVLYKKETELDFSDVMVNGELIKPNGLYVQDIRGSHFKADVGHRKNFRREFNDTLGSL